MIDAWAKAEELSNKIMEGSGVYVRLANDGDKVVGVFCGDPHARQVHWTGTAYEECTGKGCAHCEAGVRCSLRVACNFYVLADKAMKIIEGGPVWFGDLLKVRKKYGLDTWAFEIERHGAANSPKTTYTILPDTKLDEGQQAQVAGAKLHNLVRDTAAAAREAFVADAGGNGGQRTEKASQPSQPPAAAGTATVPHEVAKALHEQLKQMPKADVAEFFEVFGVERVSQLAAVDEGLARRFIAERENLPF